MKFKNTFILLLSCIWLSQAQVVESYQFIQSYSVADLQQVVANFGASGAINPAYAVDLYRVNYRTEFNDSTTLVTGALAIPQNTDCKPPLISYQHGTTFNKLGVPSYGSGELQICLVFASEGNVIVAPDYIGLGGSTVPIHPYQHAFSQGHSTINLLRAARELQDDLSFDMSNQLFLFGYSQGGHATASAVKYIEQWYSDEFTITAAMPMSGAFDMTGAQTDFVNNGQPYATPGYLPYLVLGYNQVYDNLYDSIQEIFISPYDSLMPYYFLAGNLGSQINPACDPYPLNMFTPEALDGYFNDPTNPLFVALSENDLLDFAPQTKIRAYYCTGDEQVYYVNSLNADSAWNANGAPDAASVYLTNEDHGGCIDDALIAARLFYGNLLNNGIEIIVSYNQQANTYTVAVLDDDINNYDILWDTGSSEQTIDNISANAFYEVTLTNKTSGCSNTKRFNLATVTGIRDRSSDLSVNIYPNPSSDFIIMEINRSSSELVRILDNQGKLVYSFEYQAGTEPMVNISALSSGVYYVHLGDEAVYQTSFVKK